MADKILRGETLAEIDSADREFWTAEEGEVAAPRSDQRQGCRLCYSYELHLR